ncbi:MAG: hypothetical protein OEW25_00065 [Nitrospira sp.]|nr:hypothetical protein [Nitrospira sp.]MDH4327060.1 hypothetical protein [Nitrospira sp.]MDH5251692.1 hypothetical protein [Nitrospira sp.]
MHPLATYTFEERLPPRAIGRALERHSRSEINTPCQSRRRWSIERQTVNHRRLGMKKIPDRPLAKDIVTEHDTVISQIA